MGFLRTLLGMKYEVLKIQLLFLSTLNPSSPLNLGAVSTWTLQALTCSAPALERVNLGSLCCLISQGLSSFLPSAELLLVAGMLGCLILPPCT